MKVCHTQSFPTRPPLVHARRSAVPAVVATGAGGATAGWVAAQAVDVVGQLARSALPMSFSAPPVDGWLEPLLVGASGPLPGLLTGAISAAVVGHFAAHPSEPEGWFKAAKAAGNALREDYRAVTEAPPDQRLQASARLGLGLGREAGRASGALQGALWGARLGLRLAGPALGWIQSNLPPGALPPGAEGFLPLTVAALGLVAGQAVGATCGGWIGSVAGGAAGAAGGIAVGPLVPYAAP